MPSKKKSKPSFNVPEELQAAPQAGWVYRSDAPPSAEPVPPRPPETPVQPEVVTSQPPASVKVPAVEAAPQARAVAPKSTAGKASSSSKSKTDSGIMDLAARTITSSFQALGNAMLLTSRIIVAPLTMGLKMLRLK